MTDLSIKYKTVDTTLDKICVHLQIGKALSLTNQKRLDKIDVADNLIRNGRSPKEVAAILVKRFPNDKISRATAYRIISDAKYVFGSVSRTDKEYWRSVLVDLILDTRKRARLDNDLKTMATCEANLFKALALDKEDPDLPPYDKLQPPVQILNVTQVFMEKYPGILPKEILAQAAKAKLKDVKNSDIEDVDHEEITTDVD